MDVQQKKRFEVPATRVIFCRLKVLTFCETLLVSKRPAKEAPAMSSLFRSLVFDDNGQDIAEYAVLVAAILIIVIGTIRLVGSNSNTVFSNVASTIQ
jgi:Flp pilus assembly pilin Flp